MLLSLILEYMNIMILILEFIGFWTINKPDFHVYSLYIRRLPYLEFCN